MTYSGSYVGGLDGGSQHSLASRHSSILGGPQEADVGGYRDYASATSHYEGQYRAVYGSASMSGAQQFGCKSSLLRCKSTQNKDNDLQSDMKAEKDCSGDQPKNTSDTISPEPVVGDLKKDDKRDELKVAQAVKDLKEDKKDEKESDQKSSSGTKTEVKADKQKVALKDNANSKGGKLKDYERLKEDNKDKGEKDETWNKSNKELCSLSLSLDALLDYTGKDVEESTFELSLFAESLYEMLQYQIEMSSADQPDDEKTVMEEDTSVDPINKPKQEEESEAEEDPEEDPEECEEMDDPEEYEQMDDPGHDSSWGSLRWIAC
ncbi:hypothetical protein H0E87_016099 [Populus deltoides]|uniref:LAIKA domain-containing protein n=1 Tax=Populus deltoides TaxID=3696 RepID=A0A8T2Y7W8_POPDE|nr:hypothetical protein H0E87_016099 [Populus deltoides]